ncbi:hypothetical protein SOL01_01000 [Streptococcus cristatus]|uniref:Uncharacterized protein n=1 Tax=Streptococcus cristatus TaxID=45634 RepID=A0A512A944_STRCR|nr:hypothetical protein SOL01_01000 [Streptococcus cristatus]
MPQIFPKTPKKKMGFFFKKQKKHSIKSALKTRRNKVLKEKVSFYLLYLFSKKNFFIFHLNLGC